MADPWVLGISASHNGGACLLHGDRIVAAVQEERLTRVKRERVFGGRPSLAVAYCLDAAGITARDLALVVTSVQGHAGDPEHDPRSNPQLDAVTSVGRAIAIPHHLAHAVSAFALSGFERAAVLVIDGVGSPIEDWTTDERACLVTPGQVAETISIYHASETTITPIEKHATGDKQWLVRQPVGMAHFDSLGGMYSAVAWQIFGDPMEAGHVMGLAPYGRATLPAEEFFTIADRRFAFSTRVPDRFDHDRRWPDDRERYQDLAASVQAALAAAVMHLVDRIRARDRFSHLCYAGGVALNGIVNEQIARRRIFDDLYIPAAAEDSGVAVGAAYYGLWQCTGVNRRTRTAIDSVGRRYSLARVADSVARVPAVRIVETDAVFDAVIDRLCAQQFCGWLDGGSELGPRALGHRSILADPRSPTAKDALNARVKRREAFRPFAPAVLATEAAAWFDLAPPAGDSPFMLRVCGVRKGLERFIPAVTHVDGSARVQTVTEADGRFHALLRRFFSRTGIPILLNTSLNVKGEPIVETPDDALWCLWSTGLDFCVIESRVVVRHGEYESLMDFVPFTLPVDYESDPLDPASATTWFSTATEWGPCRRGIASRALAIVPIVDGRRTGWEIAGRLATELSLSRPAAVARTQTSIEILRRYGIIGLRAPVEAVATGRPIGARSAATGVAG